MKTDDKMLCEMYEKIQKNTIEEAGWFSRQGARLGGVSGALKQGVGDTLTAMAGKAPAPDAGWKGKYDANKRESIMNNLTNTINTDLSKLGLFGKDKSGKTNRLGPNGLKDLRGVLDTWLNRITNKTPDVASATSSPATPAASPTSTAPATPVTPAASPTSTAPTSTSPSTGPSSATGVQSVQPDTTATTTTPSAPEPIPNESRINGTYLGRKITFEYDEADGKWKESLGGGKSTGDIPEDDEVLQNKITTAWHDKVKKDKAAAAKNEADAAKAKAKAKIPTFESFSRYWT